MSEAKTPEQIEAEIAQQREELAGTVDALQAKLDVKARAKSTVADVQNRVTTDSGKPRPDLTAAAVGVVVLVVAIVVWRRRRR